MCDKLPELTRCYLAEKKQSPYEHIVQYLETTADLPRNIIEYAYSAKDPAVSVQTHGINAIAEQIPLRSNSKLRKGNAAAPQNRDGHSLVEVEADTADVEHRACPGAGSSLPSDAARGHPLHAENDPEEQALRF